MKVTLVDSMGTDLSVVNAARVSFAKEHKEFSTDKDERLIRFLAQHNHWSPFGHA
jgi:thymidylate synthase (FAD)